MNTSLVDRATRVARSIHSVHFWLIVAIMVGLTILHYVEQLNLAGTSPSVHFGLERHTIDRILFLIPIVYTIIVFGPVAGIFISIFAMFIMLPRALIWSPNTLDASIETVGIVVTAIAICLWLKARLSEAGQRQQAEEAMDIMQDELQSHIRQARSNEIRLATLNAISNILSHSLELEGLLHSTISMVMQVMEVEAVLIFSLDEDSQKLNLVAFDGVSDRFVQEKSGIDLGEGLNGLVAKTGEPLMVEDASHDPRLTRDVVRDEKIQAQLIIPLKSKGQITGTLSVANRRPRQFLPQEIQLLTAIGNQLAIALENARLYQEQQLAAAQYRGIFENASEAIWVQDLEDNIIAANDATARLTGYSRQELLKMKAPGFLSENGSELAKEIRRRLLQGELISEPYERRLIRKDGKAVILKITSNPIISDGKSVAFQHIGRDVTKEKQVEDNLRFHIEHITKAQEEERSRIARELHDETAQQLIALSHQLEDFTRNNKRLSPDDISLLGGWRNRIKDTLQGLRWFVRELRPPMIDDLGLLPAVKWLTDEQKNLSDMTVDLKVIGNERRFKPEAELLLFRIVQEALANVRRHANASKVEVILEFTKNKTMVTITDNGKGFQLPKAEGDLPRLGKLGLLGMEERARLLNGRLKVQSELGTGTTINIEAPI